VLSNHGHPRFTATILLSLRNGREGGDFFIVSGAFWWFSDIYFLSLLAINGYVEVVADGKVDGPSHTLDFRY
jgi:hypothetical protein